MENNLFNFEKFKNIFEKLTVSSRNLETLKFNLKEIFYYYENIFHIGKITLKSNLPINFYSEKIIENIDTIYESIEGYSEDYSHSKKFNVPNNKGEITIITYPLKEYTFTLEDLNNLELLDELIYIFYSRLRYMKIIQDANNLDSLTSAPNLNGVTRFLDELIEKNIHNNYDCIFFNLRNLKFFNNTYGMKVVNDLLRDYFTITNSFIDIKEEIIGRAGGDSFVAIINKNHTNSFLKVIESIELSLKDGVSQKNVKVSSRAGIFRIEKNNSISDIMEGAFIALNISKEMKDLDVVYFNPNMLSNILYGKKLLNLFPEACENEEFIILYQPKVDLNSNTLSGAEALVRWIKDDKIIPPFQFVPIFEKGNCICSLDFYVLERVCKDIRNWLDKGIEPVRVSINFSKKHLKDSSLTKEILFILDKYKIDAKYIGIEFNEASNPEEYESLIDLVDVLKEKNLIVSIDNFGKGFSSLNIVRNLKTDIKLDKSFIDMIEIGTEDDRRFLINLIQMLQSFDIEIVAEGVETEKEILFLKKNNCHFIQGYFFDKPLVYNDFEKRLVNKIYKY